ncbi:NusA-like transcription termination signal-binding factor [archaeon CG10_big_fil_rev_8_21_14_0_10_43_11]|nr:MAG: NusA-like transcription termination signal-binding factor [archaeon CG10_big_fil_rev_8_21_14_0_10_43_11]
MVRIKLDTDSLRFVGLFESVTGARVKDCIVGNNKIIFVVEEGQAGLAIGRRGSNIVALQNKLNKKVEVIEFSQDPVKFASNIFHPAKLGRSYVSTDSSGNSILHLSPESDKGLVKSKFKYATQLIKRYHNITIVRLT